MSKNIDSCNHPTIYLVEGNYAVLKSYRGYPKWFLNIVSEIPKPIGFTWKTILDGKPRYVANADKDKYIGPAGKKVGTKSYASMPIILDGETIGAININSKKYNAFDEEEINLLNIVAKQIEAAIKNARQADLLRKSNDKLEARVEERTKSLSETNKMLTKEINNRKNAEQKIINSLKEKEVLLMEINHRVKNNLQLISSLLKLQSRKIKDQSSLKVFNESCSRIKSIALLHEQLYRSEMMDRIDFSKYLKDLLKQIKSTFTPAYSFVNLEIFSEGIELDINRAIPCGLIVNELVNNAFVHGLKNFKKGFIKVYFTKKNKKYNLRIINSGSKFPAEINLKNPLSLGLQLVTSLTDQLEGKVILRVNPKTEFKIEFTD